MLSTSFPDPEKLRIEHNLVFHRREEEEEELQMVGWQLEVTIVVKMDLHSSGLNYMDWQTDLEWKAWIEKPTN